MSKSTSRENYYEVLNLGAKEDNFRHIVRVVDTDLDGNKPIKSSLRKIKGVSFMFANMTCNSTGVDPYKKTGHLSDAEVKELNNFIRNPFDNGVPSWMVNRRKDYEDGTDKHLLSNDLKFTLDNDLKRLKKIKAYRGTRHMFGLPSRGQRTKSNFRKNKGKGSLGVKRKKK